jgi:hypothetical protein
MSRLKTLRSNLIVYAAIQETDKLIAMHGKLYAKASLSGRIVCFLCRHFCTQGNVDVVIKAAKQQFTSMMDRLDVLQKEFLANEVNRVKGLPFQAAKTRNAEREILYSCLLFRPLLKEFAKGRQSFLKEQLTDKANDWKKLCLNLRFIDQKRAYERLTRQPLPLELFQKAAFKKPMLVREEKRLKQWIACLKERENGTFKGFNGKYPHEFVKVRKLHRFVYELYHHFLKPEKAQVIGGNPSLGALEAKLEAFGLNLSQERDRLHLDWVESLAKGQTITIQGQDYVIGTEVTTAIDKERDMRAFVLDDNRDIVFYKNEAGAYLEVYQAQEEHCGIPLVKILSRKEKGAMAIREAITDTLDQIVWTSKEVLTEEDAKVANPLVDLITYLFQLPYTPYPLETSAFGYHVNGEMRALKTMKQSAFFFEAIEQFAYRIAQGNTRIFTYLMRMGPQDHSDMAKEYREFTARALEAISRNEPIEMPKKHALILERYQLLANRLSECYRKEIEKPGQRLDRKNLAIAIFKKYRNEGFVSFLPPDYSL